MSRRGTVHCRDPVATPLPRQWFPASSHQLGAAEAIERAHALGRLPQTLVFIGIAAAADVGHGEGLTLQVAQALPQAADAIAGLVASP